MKIHIETRSRHAVFVLLFVGLALGCQTYEPKPLDPREIIEEVERARRLLEDDGSTRKEAAEGKAFTLERAAELMSLNSPALREVKAEYQSALGLAEVETPFPNPSLEAGPKIGSNLEDSSHRVQPFISLGFTIPLSSRLKREDDVNQKAADLAFLKVLLKHRGLYLDLRLAYSQWILAQTRIRVGENITSSLEKALDLTRQLVEAGSAGALDVGQMELELYQSRMDLFAARAEAAEKEAALSELLGIHAGRLGPIPENILPDIPEELPDMEKLKRILVRNHLELGLLRGEYEKAESELELEIAKQYPDLRLGTAFEKDPGETSRDFEFTLGVDLPIFDRNQQGIAKARMQREEIREKYRAEANRALARLEKACRRLDLARGKRAWFEDRVLPRARSNVDLAKRSVLAARIDSLQLLDVERALSKVLIEAIDSEMDVRGALIEIEKAVGRPLWLFPSEKEGMIPSLPDDLDQPTNVESDS